MREGRLEDLELSVERMLEVGLAMAGDEQPGFEDVEEGGEVGVG